MMWVAPSGSPRGLVYPRQFYVYRPQRTCTYDSSSQYLLVRSVLFGTQSYVYVQVIVLFVENVTSRADGF